MDLYNREIIGWRMHSDMSQIIIAKALKMALKHRRIDWAGFGLIFHSDRGSQYTVEATRRIFKRLKKIEALTPAKQRAVLQTVETELIS